MRVEPQPYKIFLKEKYLLFKVQKFLTIQLQFYTPGKKMIDGTIWQKFRNGLFALKTFLEPIVIKIDGEGAKI